MSDSGEDWDEEISSGVSKTVHWTNSVSNADTNSQNSRFSTREIRSSRGRGRARGSSDNWRATNGSNNSAWNSFDRKQDLDKGWPRKPGGGFDSRFSARDEQPVQSRGFGEGRDVTLGARWGDGGALRIEVSSRDVGKIIGKGGQSIKNIQNTSGARIKILKDEADAIHTPIEISGSAESQSKAKNMIDEIISPQDLANKMEETTLKTEETPFVPRIDWGELRANRLATQAKKWEVVRKSHRNRRIAPEMKKTFSVKNISSCLLAVACVVVLSIPLSVYIGLSQTKISYTLDNANLAVMWSMTAVVMNCTFNCLIFYWKNKVLRTEGLKVLKSLKIYRRVAS